MKINHIFGFEKLRDGGSLVASFQSDDSCEYWVMFPIENRDVSNPEFKDPILINRTTGVEMNLNRSDAKQWLAKLELYFEERSDLSYVTKQSETEILNKMLTLCKLNI